MNISFGNVVKLNLPEENKKNVNIRPAYKGYSNSNSVLNTLGNLKGDELATRLIQFLIGDKSKKNEDSVHKFVNLDGDIYMLSGTDYDNYIDLRNCAISRICDSEQSSDTFGIAEKIDSGEFENPVSSLMQKLYKDSLKDSILGNPNRGRLDIRTNSDGYISQMAYNSKNFRFQTASKS